MGGGGGYIGGESVYMIRGRSQSRGGVKANLEEEEVNEGDDDM